MNAFYHKKSKTSLAGLPVTQLIIRLLMVVVLFSLSRWLIYLFNTEFFHHLTLKEASRLLGGVEADKILADTEKFARQISEKYGCTTVLKSHETIICSKSGEIFKNFAPNSAIAKAGSGDVLSGVIVSLLAQGLDEFNSAKTGVKLHSLAGFAAKEKLGEYCVLPSDIVDFLPKAFKQMQTNAR